VGLGRRGIEAPRSARQRCSDFTCRGKFKFYLTATRRLQDGSLYRLQLRDHFVRIELAIPKRDDHITVDCDPLSHQRDIGDRQTAGHDLVWLGPHTDRGRGAPIATPSSSHSENSAACRLPHE
jgi:hypothetical protein